MKFYLCKYIPPRADFLATMTAEERKWMKQHGDFLNNLLDKGLIVAHGPVMDPSGGYGVSLYQIADDQDIATITSEDPIVKNGAGHYEHYPMLHLKSRVTLHQVDDSERGLADHSPAAHCCKELSHIHDDRIDYRRVDWDRRSLRAPFSHVFIGPRSIRCRGTPACCCQAGASSRTCSPS